MLLNHFVIISFTVHNDMVETEMNLSVLFCWSLDAAQPRCSVLGWFELISCRNFTFLIFSPPFTNVRILYVSKKSPKWARLNQDCSCQ